MAQRAYDEEDEGGSTGGTVVWLGVVLVYILGLILACLAGALLAGWRG